MSQKIDTRLAEHARRLSEDNEMKRTREAFKKLVAQIPDKVEVAASIGKKYCQIEIFSERLARDLHRPWYKFLCKKTPLRAELEKIMSEKYGFKPSQYSIVWFKYANVKYFLIRLR